MKVVYCAVGKAPAVKEVKNDTESLQELVNGYLEVVRLANSIVLVCNEDGKLLGLKPNCKVVYEDDPSLSDIIVGNFFLCRMQKGEFVSLKQGDWGYLTKETKTLKWGNLN